MPMTLILVNDSVSPLLVSNTTTHPRSPLHMNLQFLPNESATMEKI